MALVQNSFKALYVMIVEKEFEEQFCSYLKKEKNYLITWLDDLDEQAIDFLKNQRKV